MISWNIRIVSHLRQFVSSRTDTSVDTRMDSKQEEGQGRRLKTSLVQFGKRLSDHFLLGSKAYLPECLVIYSNQIICSFLSLCKENKDNISSHNSTKFVG